MKTSVTDVAEVMGTYFTSIYSNTNYRPEFSDFGNKIEKEELRLLHDDGNDYNTPFEMRELETALSRCSDTSPGADEIHYQMLKNLTTEGKTCVLASFNQVWASSSIPPT